MTGKRWIFVLMVGLALLLAALACGPSLGGAPDTGGEPAAPAGGEGTGGEQPSGDDVPLNYTGTDVSGLSSYRSQFSMNYSGTDDTGAAVQGSFTLNEAYSADPPATSTSWQATGDDPGLGVGSFGTTQIGDVTYMVTDDGSGQTSCITMTEEGAQQSPALTPDTFLSGADLSAAKRVLPDEMVNGVMTRHYRSTPVEAALGGFSNYTLDIWVAVDGGYSVREALSADGALVGFGTGTGHIEWTYDLLDINGPVDIQAPEGCEAPAGSDFPRMADATNVGSFGGLLTYDSASPLADVVAFYQAELPAQGWAAGTATTDVPGFATLEFTRGEESVSVTITEADGTTSVLASFE